MPAAAIPAITGGLGLVGNLVGGGKAANAQSQDASAASGLYGQESAGLQRMLHQYFSVAAPALSAFVKNPAGSPAGQAAYNMVEQGNTSLLNTLRGPGGLGGVANPNALIEQLATSGQQNAMQSAAGLGSQWLSAIQGMNPTAALGQMGQLGATYGAAGSQAGAAAGSAFGGSGQGLGALFGSPSGSTSPGAAYTNIGNMPMPGGGGGTGAGQPVGLGGIGVPVPTQPSGGINPTSP